MVNWRSLAPRSLKKSFSSRGADKAAAGRKRLSNKSLRLESFEQRTLFAIGPQLIAIIPNEGEEIQANQILHVPPRELTFRFDDGQTIDPSAANLANIQIVRGGDHILGNGNDLTVTTGFVGIGERPNEVIVRFNTNLPDDKYQITIKGQLKNAANQTFN